MLIQSVTPYISYSTGKAIKDLAETVEWRYIILKEDIENNWFFFSKIATLRLNENWYTIRRLIKNPRTYV
ncbi:hypothetical protein RN001_012064 [Aquatica leii]|uniref:Uncharacterized protein n=1 Tax=Aquatica leii TaxID=1421715 RepID=A0AAN7SD45_9COLE|nr:hypothetical protein RN001_012064 [Aquatica leii]